MRRPDNTVKRILAIPAILLLLTLPACTKAEPASCGEGDITANPWVLQTYGPPARPESLVPGTQITISFLGAGTKIAGSTGCNAYFGSSEVDGRTCRLKIDSIGATERGCDVAVSRQEQKFLGLLKAAQNYHCADGKLRIVCGKEQLNFIAYEETQ